MKEAKNKWYLIDIASKLKNDPFQTIAYFLVLIADITGYALVTYFYVRFIKYGGIEQELYNYLPNYDNTDSVLFIILTILFAVSFVLLCVAFIKSNAGAKRTLLCVALAIIAMGTIMLIILELLIAFSERIIGTYIIARACLLMVCIAVITAVVFIIRDSKLKIYMQKWIGCYVRTFIFIPLLLSMFGTEKIGVFFVTLVIGVFVFYAIKYMCPYCKKGYGLKKVNIFVMNERNIVVKVKSEERDKATGDVLTVRDEYVPGLETTYGIDCVCRYCGKACRKRKIRKAINQ